MALFGKMFEKKQCSICGGDIGLLGNRKLEDGNCCKNCAAKLSYWFSERRKSTVSQIEEQIAYREANQSAVDNFHTTRQFGERYRLCVDEGAQKFMIVRTSDVVKENPDVIDLSAITNVEIDIDERKDEQMQEYKDEEGKTQKKSFVPARFIFYYDFNIVIYVNHPYFDDLKFQLNRSEIPVDVVGRTQYSFNPAMKSNEYRNYDELAKEIKEYLLNGARGQGGATVATSTPQEPVVEAPVMQSAPKYCQWCGQQAVPNEEGNCPHCGGKM